MATVAPKNAVMERVWSMARKGQKRIVLPETEDERTLQAAEMIEKANLGRVILLGKEDEVRRKAKEAGANIDNIPVIDPEKYEKFEEYAQKLLEIRKGKIASIDDARNLLKNYLYFGVTMVKLDDADGMVAGAVNTSADVERPAFQIIKTAPGISIASAYFAMIVPDCPYGEKGFFLYADSGGHPNPTAEELADIAITTCMTMKNIFGVEEPRAAMLSYSTKGSASHPIVDKVIEATKIANKKRPDLLIDGELQGDAALVPEIGRKKAPGSPVAGRANILIFPDLNAGNIAYKLTERLAKAEAYGPLLQGLDKPVNDLSRGCKATDIVNVAAIVAVKAMVPYGKRD
ncbi:phosphate acetyltransferase Pta [Thermacetogenium phaeum DSM 12270]|uniref:Phosphate acetyltransferase n=2 Tax=Thermacetogenium phaeum TaxID=85874 RepID=K4LDW8_THEPS|nr:phosphate acetyltransferase [Thermacetogenium phaeum]AFV11231.1 phosphate acetyltransferase Pta [Thermacetogenium phaeum DSM 12270]KUK36528.1 MAG: Phosphate acetyltransferase Pta [Thermacetogenium phaeum]MDN5364899.1 phosphate acetyltransferase [Thermacetogenium sp.]